MGKLPNRGTRPGFVCHNSQLFRREYASIVAVLRGDDEGVRPERRIGTVELGDRRPGASPALVGSA